MKGTLVLFLLLSLTFICTASEIHDAIDNDELATVKALLAENAECINETLPDGRTPLHCAVYTGKTRIAEFLIENGADINAPKANGSRPLHGAAFYKFPECVELLVEKGANINARTSGGYTPILSAATRGNTEIVKYLLDHDAYWWASTDYGQTLLHFMAQYGMTDLIAEVLDAGEETDKMDAGGEPPLSKACWQGQTEAANLLLERGANPNLHAVGRWSPLCAASAHGHTDIVELLVNKHANVNYEMSWGGTALSVAVERGHEDVSRLLLENGADPDLGVRDGMGPVFYAASRGAEGVVGDLLNAGANYELAEDHNGMTPLHAAACRGYAKAVEQLVKAGADVNSKDLNNRTPYYYAAHYGNKKVADYLLANGAEKVDVDARFDDTKMLDKKLSKGESVFWYLGHCAFAVKTRNNLMIFDYWKQGTDPTEPCLANGTICCEDIKDLDVTVFVTHEHGDHFDPRIFEWADKVENIKYVYGFQPEQLDQYAETPYDGPEFVYAAPRTEHKFGKMQVNTLAANDAGVGYLVQVDGVTIYHAGDHAGWRTGQDQAYKEEIDYIAQYTDGVDVAMVNVTGCHTQDQCALDEGNAYTVEKLKPAFLVPTHGVNREFVYKEYAERNKDTIVGTEFLCPDFIGDRFHIKKGTLLAGMKFDPTEN